MAINGKTRGNLRPIRTAVAYVRVSSEDQADADRFSLPAQRREIAAFCQAKGWEIVAWYGDEGRSARSDSIAKRPALQQLLEETGTGAVQADVAVVHEVSRWARNRAVFFGTLSALAERRIAFASVKEDIDYSTPEGQMFLSILATFAAYFSDALAAHTSKGKQERARQGFYNGDLPYGYVNPTPGKSGEYNKSVPVIVPEEAAGVRLAFDTYAAGAASDAEIASQLNQAGYRTRNKAAVESRTGHVRNPHHLWTKDTVNHLLQNPFYTGQVRYKGDLHPGQHAPVVNADTFRRCQEQRTKRQHGGAGMVTTGRTYLLKGIAYCAGCREPLRSNQAHGSTCYYRCVAGQRGLACPAIRRTIRGDDADALVAALVGRLALPADWRESVVQRLAESDGTQDALRRRELLERKLQRLKAAYLDLEMSKAEYESARDPLAAELAALVIPEAADLERAGAYLERLGDLWQTAELEDRHALCAELFDAVYLDVDQGRITEVRIRPDYAPLFAREIVSRSGTDEIRYTFRTQHLTSSAVA